MSFWRYRRYWFAVHLHCLSCIFARIALQTRTSNTAIALWCDHTLWLNHTLLQMTPIKSYHWICFVAVLSLCLRKSGVRYSDVIMGTIASQITSLTIVYSTVYSGADERKNQSSPSLSFVRGIHRGLVNSPHKWSVTRKMFPFDDVIMD